MPSWHCKNVSLMDNYSDSSLCECNALHLPNRFFIAYIHQELQKILYNTRSSVAVAQGSSRLLLLTQLWRGSHFSLTLTLAQSFRLLLFLHLTYNMFALVAYIYLRNFLVIYIHSPHGVRTKTIYKYSLPSWLFQFITIILKPQLKMVIHR